MDYESDAIAPPAQPAAQTVEDWATSLAAERGQDTTSPEGQAAIKAAAAKIRAAMPGIPDADIIAKVAPVMSKTIEAAKKLPPPPGQPGFDFEQYKTAVQKMQQDFGAESRLKVEQQARMNNLGNIVGRNLSSAARIAAGPAHQKVLDEQYQANAAAANQPIQDWQTRKAEALANIEQQIKTGEVQQSQVKAQLANMGLEQALAERKDKATIAASEADPSSITSETYRHLADQFAPELRAKLGAKFDTLTASQLKAQLPALEKQYLKKIEIEQKRAELEDKEKARVAAAAEKAADREFRAGESAKDRAARLQAANIRAAASAAKGNAGPTPAAVNAAEGLAGRLDKESRAVADKTAGAEDALVLFDRVDELVKKGLKTGPIVGGDNVVGKAYSLFSGNKQEADQIAAQLVAAMAKTFGGAPSQKEGEMIREANTIMKLDNPGPALAALKAKFQKHVEEGQAQQAAIQAQKARVLSRVGVQQPEAAPSGPQTISDKKAYDALPKGATYIDGRDGKMKVKG